MSNNNRLPLTGNASQETFVSLLQLDPMPMPDSPAPTPPAVLTDTDKELPPLPQDADVEAGTKEASPSSHSRSISRSAPGATPAAGLHTGYGAVYYLSRIQRYSSYAFTIFTSVHLATTSLIPLASRSVPASEAYLLLAREIYQTRLSEPLLVFIPVVAHVAAGVGLRLVRRNQNLRRYGGATPGLLPVTSRKDAHAHTKSASHASNRQRGDPTWSDRLVGACTALGRRITSGWPPLSFISASGYLFTITLAGHIFVNRLLPLAVEGDSSDIGLAYVAHGFARHPVMSWASYVVFLGAASGHVVWGWARWLRIAQRAEWTSKLNGHNSHANENTGDAASIKALRRRRRHNWLAVQGCVLIAFALWASGSLIVVARGGPTKGWVAKIYDGIYSKMGL